ncbi:S-adenosyl-L-methionine-dependent methyltransferase superfamily protein [Abeliophyllum distichum]|uniref:S-adenosyl-L-methionine-dependent methyltransferase superfamily protein n=1 Tax=Abeliophyllum distichum TaxID=126358 RepID=A0ABD1PCS2_9LAMI
MVAKDSYNSFNGHAMTGGNGLKSYTKNSSYQRGVIDAAKLHIQSAIAKKLQPEKFTTLETFSIADLGCSVGPNTFFAVQNILESVKVKYKTHEHYTKIPEFQVFFNDHSMNDFNTLFECLPPSREYYASGVPGSFYSRLFLRASVHFVHSSYSLHWLSQVPKEVTNRKELAWNKGRIYHLHAREEVTHAYSMQHAMDMTNFLIARAEEVVPSGLVAIIIPARPNGTLHDQQQLTSSSQNCRSKSSPIVHQKLLHQYQYCAHRNRLLPPSPSLASTSFAVASYSRSSSTRTCSIAVAVTCRCRRLPSPSPADLVLANLFWVSFV